mgnify:CR=1 FL=1
MRVIAGSARSLRLKTLDGMDTRPTTDRIKETLFNMIGPSMFDCVFLDLFAGSGALALEALSRGAASCTFVDAAPAAVAVIRQNIEKTGFADRARVQNADYRNFLRKCKEDGFDLVFLDPPYASDALADALLRLCESGLLHRGCILACESETGGVLEKDARLAEAYTLLKGSHYGRVHIELLTPQAAEV